MRIKVPTIDGIKQIEIIYENLFFGNGKIIAEIDNCTVGFLLIQQLMTQAYTCLIEHKYAFITDIIVDSNYQKQ